MPETASTKRGRPSRRSNWCTKAITTAPPKAAGSHLRSGSTSIITTETTAPKPHRANTTEEVRGVGSAKIGRASCRERGERAGGGAGRINDSKQWREEVE